MTSSSSVEIKNRAKRQFESWADSYDRSLLNHFMFRPACMALMEEIARWYDEQRRPFCVLDIGCGTGTLACRLAGSPWPVSVVGMDYAEGMCQAASAKAAHAGHQAHFATGDSEHLPFADASFDIVTCSNSFHHYPHQQAVVHAMRRTLRPGGRMILIDGFRDNIVGWITFDVIISRVEGKVYHAPWTVVRDYFQAAGFTAIHRRKLNFWFPLLVTIGDVE
ncbi:MAG: methyltransferase domain-containing protein [Phycisphaerae bacterium]|nr:methyltransferase domain-containing protein [Phycisphaerae bacterium]